MVKVEEQLAETSAEEAVANEDAGEKKLSRARALFSRLKSDRSVRSALFSFALTRLLIFTLFILAMQARLPDPSKRLGDPLDPVISMERAPVAQNLRRLAGRGDGGWYLSIAVHGYDHVPFDAARPHDWAFFPAYPLLVRAVTTVTRDYPLTAIALSNLLFFAALLVLHKTVLALGLDVTVADRVLIYVAAFPMSHFFSLPHTESLFLLLSAGCFYAALKDRWAVAGAVGAIASATRVIGVLLAPALLLLYLKRHGKRWSAQLLWVLLVPVGLVLYMLYLWRVTGDPLAFKHVLVAWGREGAFFLAPLYNFFRSPLLVSISWDLRFLNFAAAILALVCGVVLAVRREWALSVYTLGCVLAPLSSSALVLQSLARYVMVIFPVFIVLARFAARKGWIDQTIRALFFALLSLMSVMFALDVSFALS